MNKLLGKAATSSNVASTQQNGDSRPKKDTNTANEVLATATTVFPFTLFPDTVTIDRSSLTITHRSFFRIAEVMTIRIEDVLNVTSYVGPFFGSVQITTRFFADKPYSVNYFWRDDALKIKQVMQGYIIARHNNIDYSNLPKKELVAILEKLGGGQQ